MTSTNLEAVVLCVVKDGESLVQAFIEHYLQLGFKHIFFLDNSSTDRTREIIADHQQTTLVLSSKPFSRYYILFKNYLIQTFGLGKWCVVADIDEFLYLPERISLKKILTYLNDHAYDTVCIQMLDMFSKAALPLQKSITEEKLEKEQENRYIPTRRWTLSQLAATFCYYDIKDIDHKKYIRWFQSRIHPAHRFLYGGIRKTVFHRDCFLTKEAMFFGRKHTRFVSSHLLKQSPLKRSRLADVSFAFLHYKFIEGFYASTLKAVIAENHWRNSSEYKAYFKVLATTDNQIGLALYQPSSQKLREFDDLVQAGFVFASDEFITFLEEAVSV
ncbi:MAG: glycosyltransferase family 2 protein [Cyanobacteria bacterium J06621_11]